MALLDYVVQLACKLINKGSDTRLGFGSCGLCRSFSFNL